MRSTSADLMTFERPLLDQGQVIVGLDEVGRGALAGPLFVGAVVLASVKPPPLGLDDSKRLNAQRRLDLDEPIRAWCDDFAFGVASASEIDRWGLRVALSVATTRALDGLRMHPTHALIDGPLNLLDVDRVPLLRDDEIPAFTYRDLPCTTVVKGDQRCATVAGASVLAKVARDDVMVSLHHECARYEWLSNKGYGTAAHIEAIRRFGPHAQHRISWKLT